MNLAFSLHWLLIQGTATRTQTRQSTTSWRSLSPISCIENVLFWGEIRAKNNNLRHTGGHP